MCSLLCVKNRPLLRVLVYILVAPFSSLSSPTGKRCCFRLVHVPLVLLLTSIYLVIISYVHLHRCVLYNPYMHRGSPPAGPTATGKSSIALALCKSIGGEIVSCDSVQVYRDVFIGCNKPSEEEMRQVRHHLVDVASLDETFNAGTSRIIRRRRICRKVITTVVGRTPCHIVWVCEYELMHGNGLAPQPHTSVPSSFSLVPNFLCFEFCRLCDPLSPARDLSARQPTPRIFRA